MSPDKKTDKRSRNWIYITLGICLSLFIFTSAVALALLNQIRTLTSLKRIDDHPLYVMTYYGDYDYLPQTQEDLMDIYGRFISPDDTASDFECSLFSTYGEGDSALYGRNYDWEDVPAILLFTNPPEGYSSISIVDISWLGFEKNSKGLPSWDMRLLLLATPIMPFDGMNEKGLVVGLAAVHSSEMPYNPSKTTIGGLQAVRLILDNAKNTDEAIEILKEHNLDFNPGPHLHYLIADRSGKSAVVEFADGEMHITYNEQNYQTATNFFLIEEEDPDENVCWRYATIENKLENPDWEMSTQYAMKILRDVSWEWTQWSAVYNMASGDVEVVMGRDYDNPHEFHLEMSD